MQFMMRKINMVAEKDDCFNKSPTTEILITGLDKWRFIKPIQRKPLDIWEKGSCRRLILDPLLDVMTQWKKPSNPLPGGGNSIFLPSSSTLIPVLSTTGLTTSSLIPSGPLNSSEVSGSSDPTGSLKSHAAAIAHKPDVINLSQEGEYSFHRSSPKPILWSMVLLLVIGSITGCP